MVRFLAENTSQLYCEVERPLLILETLVKKLNNARMLKVLEIRLPIRKVLRTPHQIFTEKRC